MSLKIDVPSNDLRMRFAHALGFLEYPTNTTAEPYLNYIISNYSGEGIEDHLELFIATIAHFGTATSTTTEDHTIQALIDRLSQEGFRDVFADTSPGTSARREHVEDSVMYIIGAWTTMLNSFQHRCGSRRVTAAYSLFADANPVAKDPLEENVSGLLNGCGLLPGGRWDRGADFANDATLQLMMLLSYSANLSNQPGLLMRSAGSLTPPSSRKLSALSEIAGLICGCGAVSQRLLEDLDNTESMSIKTVRLNAFKMNMLSAVDIKWTPNVSRHMLLSKTAGRHDLELFSLPCAFDAINSSLVGVSAELTMEIQESYAMLFNAWPDTPSHTKFGSAIGVRHWCQCWSCSAYRYRQRCLAKCRAGASDRSQRSTKALLTNDYDPLLETLSAGSSMPDWTPDDFPLLWSRIARLEQHLQSSRPWNIWVLFRDRRDTMQFWTFLLVP